jgi:hypothetical protein
MIRDLAEQTLTNDSQGFVFLGFVHETEKMPSSNSPVDLREPRKADRAPHPQNEGKLAYRGRNSQT